MGFQRGEAPLAGQGQRPCGGVGAEPPQNQSEKQIQNRKNEKSEIFRVVVRQKYFIRKVKNYDRNNRSNGR